ncbi:hypothetical protein ACVGVM_18955 [Pseudonocardia bannensis]|uniref:Uncharacterized protein n=1 Tax=Pseudonocardia bannensis TaxID=630973 RepID=A0A848DIP6_9PSEU|nr:hypothetical protein [Pseudonocardia bannensis]NMH92406.1 hypothetical protein [Pseudonocardia bannensis]
MSYQITSYWTCTPCQVEGRDPEHEPNCWNCGGPVTVTARPVVTEIHVAPYADAA